MNLQQQQLLDTVLNIIMQIDKERNLYKKELISKLCPPYTVNDIEFALDYLSHSHFDGDEHIKEKIGIINTQTKMGDTEEIIDDLILIKPEPKRANTATELKDAGLDEYQVPTEFGDFIGTLDYKKLGKTMNLWCFFTLEDGKKIKLSCFRYDRTIRAYCARDQKYDFSAVGSEGNKFKLTIGRKSKDTISFESAELV